jgi:hypothetical protein
MDFRQAEKRFHELEASRNRGELDDSTFRVQVAKLMFRDARGAFWMLDADDGTWYCNRGTDWETGDPRAEEAAAPVPSSGRRRQRWRRAALAIALTGLLGLALVLALQRWPAGLWGAAQPAPVETPEIEVLIASPGNNSQVAIGQEVAVESTLNASAGLQRVDRVELLVGGQAVDSQSVRSRIQPGQTSLPVSQHWMPSALGEQQVTVAALSEEGERLGEATITLVATELADESVPEPECSPEAAFVADVTIPPGSAFPPGAKMDKVWQVRNNGTCAWGVGYNLARVQRGALLAPDTVSVPPTAAGATADLAVTFSAPSQAGTYTDTWQLQTPDGTSFGPPLTLLIEVEVEAETSSPPEPPAELGAAIAEEGMAVQLTWLDRSDNEDAFRVYRDDIDASIGLAPANAELFLDRTVACGNTYQYHVVAFNSAGVSALSDAAEVALPSCTHDDALPALVLTVVPTQVVASGTITIAFQATDDLGLAQVEIQGEETGNAELDAGLIFACEKTVCAGTWPVTVSLSALGVEPTAGISGTLTIVGVARDSAGQESAPQELRVVILPPD